ncbi:MAG: hypothetical protein CMG62_08245 [Candidatus Marinimicrobia bacterium]|nr:hypothetical protein [Candidatus Neomarinimicrobiota bacterium]
MLQRAIFILVLFCNPNLAQIVDTTNQKSPKKAFLFSLIPSGGQLYNGRLFKAALVAGLEIASIQQWSRYRKAFNNWSESSPLNQRQYLEKRNKYAWWIWFIYMFGMLEAVVDAHLYPFEKIMETDIKNSNQGGLKNNE